MVTDVSASLSWCLSAVLMFRAWFFVRFKFQHYFRVSPVVKMVRTQVSQSCRECSSPPCSTSFDKQDCMVDTAKAPPPPTAFSVPKRNKNLVVWRRRRRKRRRKRRRRRKSPSVDPWFHLGPSKKGTFWFLTLQLGIHECILSGYDLHFALALCTLQLNFFAWLYLFIYKPRYIH